MKQAGQLTTESQSLSVVPAGLNGVAPVAVRDIPFDGLEQAVVERARGCPAELPPDLRRVDRVSPVVARTIGHEGLERAIRLARRLRQVERRADAIDDLEVGALVSAADIVLPARLSFAQHEEQTGAV